MNRVLKLASAGLIATILPLAAFAQGTATTGTAPAATTATGTVTPAPDAKAGTPMTMHDTKTPATHAAAHAGKTVASKTAVKPVTKVSHTPTSAKTAPGAS
ncbi:MAG: hypothetical protein P4L71_17840 [Acetobacteraceae bacterium]|nr:hypothetical protein [Acetobacteraceae bacterium]